MKTTRVHKHYSRSFFACASILFAGFAFVSAEAQQIKWGLTVTNINNPITPTIVTNANGSVSITAGGGDTYDNPDSFTYAYQQVTGDFDVRVRVMNVVLSDPNATGPDSAKGALMARATLDSVSPDFQINATPLAPAGRDGEIESIARMRFDLGTDDIPGRMQKYGGDSTVSGYATYPDCWLRIQRQGEKLMSYFATTNTTNFPDQSNPGSTNGWQLMCVVHTGTNFPKTLYVGLSTVAHNGDISDTVNKVTSTYDAYGPTPTPPSIPSVNGAAAIPGTGPGAFPNTKVLAANFDASIAADGLGYPPDTIQSAQGPGQQIIWNSGNYGPPSVARDIIANISSQTPGAFSFARYQAGSFDFLLNPRDPVAALGNLGPYSNPNRERYTSGGTNIPASQAWAPSPDYGVVFTTVHKNGQQWNDTAPFFYASTYVQLDGVATGQGYDMISGHFRGAQFYTRTAKPVTGSPTDPSSNLGNLQRCAIPIAIAWFPYDQGWKAGFFDAPDPVTGVPHWKRGDGWGLNSGTALNGLPVLAGQNYYNSPTNLLNWVDLSGGSFAGLATITIPGVNSTNDGMLFTIGNDENNSTRGPLANNAPLADGSGWYVAVRDIETSKASPTTYATGGGSDAGASFSFLYVPYNADNLIGGHVRTNGTVSKSAGSFTVSRLSTGRYALSIPGKTGSDGVLILQDSGYLAGQPNVVDTSFLSYEYGGTNTPASSFIIESRFVNPTGGEGTVTLRDADFNFIWVDFQNPLAPPGTVPPVLTITKSGSNVIVSWTNGPGFILEKSSSLSGGWTTVGTQNPSAPIAIGALPQYFRAKSP